MVLRLAPIATVSTSAERLISGHTGRMLGVLSIGLAVVKVGRRTLPPLLPAIIADLSITAFQAGLTLSAAAACVALLQFPGGRISDQLTRKTVIIASLLVLAAGSLILSSATTFALFVLGAIVIGVGEGLYGSADRGLLSDLFERKRGTAFGIHSTFSDIGGVVGAGLAAGVLTFGVWRVAFVPAAFGGCLVAVLLYRLGREPIIVERVSISVVGTGERLFSQRRFQLLIVAYSLFAFTVQGVYAFLPTLLQVSQDASPQFASIAFASLFAVGIVCRPLAGWLSDRLSRTGIAGVSVVLGAAGIATLLAGHSMGGVAIGIVGFALSKSVFPPVMQAHLMDVFPDASMAGDLGASRTVYIGIGSLGPAYVGYVAGYQSYPAAFVGFIVALLASGAILLGLHLTR